MATTATTTSNQPVTYSLLVILTVDPSTDEHVFKSTSTGLDLRQRARNDGAPVGAPSAAVSRLCGC